MDLAFSPEQEQFRDSVRKFLEKNSCETDVRRLMESEEGFDPAVWSLMATQLGLQGLVIPEQYGGSGCTYEELVLVLEEMGRALLCAPFFSTVALAVNALIASGDESAMNDILPGIASGDRRATVALSESSDRWDEPGIQMTATASGRLNGYKTFVVDGHTADVIIVPARQSGQVSLYLVDGHSAGLTRTPLSTLDQTRKMASLEFAGVAARRIGEVNSGWESITRVRDLAAIALAAEQVGGAQRVLEMSVEYAKSRIQFGRPIGSFQAIKHKCADMLIEVEAAKSALYYATATVTEGDTDLSLVAPLVKSFCSEAFFHAASENIQIHGGIGFTWEHPAHLYFKRAKSSELLLGDPAQHRALLARRLGIA